MSEHEVRGPLLTVEVHCFACTASTSVRVKRLSGIAHALSERGWDNTRGVIACKAHRHAEVMPRHRSGRPLS